MLCVDLTFDCDVISRYSQQFAAPGICRDVHWTHAMERMDGEHGDHEAVCVRMRCASNGMRLLCAFQIRPWLRFLLHRYVKAAAGCWAVFLLGMELSYYSYAWL